MYIGEAGGFSDSWHTVATSDCALQLPPEMLPPPMLAYVSLPVGIIPCVEVNNILLACGKFQASNNIMHVRYNSTIVLLAHPSFIAPYSAGLPLR